MPLAKPIWHEFELIRFIQQAAGYSARKGQLPIGDDAAAYTPRRGYLELVTCDAMVEQVHWQAAWSSLASVAEKLVAVNISDIAAMAGIPERAYLVMAIPTSYPASQVRGMLQALIRALGKYGVRLCGGDTVATPGPMMLALTLQGVVKASHMLTRSKARPGDWILVTGDLGGAAAGLKLLQQSKRIPVALATVRERLLHPVPRLKEGQFFGKKRQVHAMLDMSDGLATDIRRLAQASQVGVRIIGKQLPIADTTDRAARLLKIASWQLALQGGEDYELLLAVPPQYGPTLCRALLQTCKTRCTVIGEVVEQKKGISVQQPNGTWMPMPTGWEHVGGSE